MINVCEKVIVLLQLLLLNYSNGVVNPYWRPFNSKRIIYQTTPHLVRKIGNSITLPSYCVVPKLLISTEGDKLDYRREYSPKLEEIYLKYLKQDFYCEHDLEKISHFRKKDYDDAFEYADRRMDRYQQHIETYLQSDQRGLNFSKTIFAAHLQAKYNELVTERLTKQKCINKKYTALVFPSVHIPANARISERLCSINKPINLGIVCDPNIKYRRIDGKCNNMVNANWGSSFFCHRRLLPPDYADGIVKPRRARDGSTLPSPRLITEILMPDIPLNDPKLTLMNMVWGQFMVHDVVRTIQNLGLAIDCCRGAQNVGKNNQKLPHPECVPIVNFPADSATIMYNQRCINTVRSTACNTCSLGPREQMNVATPFLDLSNVYGGNLINNSWTLRTFSKGRMRGSYNLKGEETLPVRQLPRDQDTLDLTACNERRDRPDLTCFQSGDGIRANQNPFVNSIHIMMHRRHNQHAEALSAINPHWDDEIVFQEARRISIAEANRINFGEYLPSILGPRLVKYFGLELEKSGYTNYNSKLDPSSIQAVAVASMRFGHSQLVSQFRVLLDSIKNSYSIFLRDKFFEMSDIWFGNSNGILRGLIEDPNNNVDPFVTTDVKDFLFFNPRTARIIDLPAININRGREHGVPGYINFLQYCTGAQIKSWKDLHQFIPPELVNKMKTVYKHYRDIDLFIGGLSESHLYGSVLGPTFACLNGIQFHHWKYGDRYYFEHGSQAGSFSLEQLNSIRDTASLANIMCKTMGFESVQANVMFVPSKDNPKILCQSFPEIKYELWREPKYY